jgi:hypothetical protein
MEHQRKKRGRPKKDRTEQPDNNKRPRGRPKKKLPEFPGMAVEVRRAVEDSILDRIRGTNVELIEAVTTIKRHKVKTDKPYFNITQETALAFAMNKNISIYMRLFFFLTSKMDYGNWVREIDEMTISKTLNVSRRSIIRNIKKLFEDDFIIVITRNELFNEYKIKDGDFLFNPKRAWKGQQMEKRDVERNYEQLKLEFA